MNPWPSRGLRRCLVLLTALVGLCLGVAANAADPNATGEVRITVDIREQLLPDALATVGELAGRPIELINPVDERKVSVSLRGAALEESLEKILYPSSYTIVWLTDDGLAIYLLDREEDRSGETGELAGQREPPPYTPISVFPDAVKVLPPEGPGGQGISMADIEYFRSFNPPTDPGEEEVLPPEEPGGVGLTLAEFEAMTSEGPSLPPSQIQVLPPEEPGGVGLTLAEFEAAASEGPSLPPSQIQVLPPEEPGGVGLTLEQWESTRQSETLDPISYRSVTSGTKESLAGNADRPLTGAGCCDIDCFRRRG